MQKPFTRRHFLNLVGAAGGSTALYQASLAMGLMKDTGQRARLDIAPPPHGRARVVVLGAGIAGLTVAYELQRAGYDCTILEASHRAGGRNLTVRHGDVIDEIGQPQVCQFDDDPELYFNCGPARIPGHHRRAMHYCKTLGVPLQIKANLNRVAYVHDEDYFGGKPVRYGEYTTDARGFMAELLYKACDNVDFDQPLSAADREHLRDMVRSYGDLDDAGRYRGSKAAGYASGGFARAGVVKPSLEFSEILNSDFWQRSDFMTQNYDWAEPLMEVVGGMDNLVKGFVRQLDKPVRLNARVQGIRLRDDGVDVVYEQDGERHEFAADYCFNSIPVHFMPAIPNNLSRPYMNAINAFKRGNFCKIGFQMRERFWEAEGIYGGMTNTSQRINQIWYPSHGIHGRKGVVLGAYAYWEESEFFEHMSPAERLTFAAECGDRIHPGYSGYIEAGVSIPWGRMNHMLGCGSRMSPEDYETQLPLLQRPEGHHYMIGDQISHHSSWQEGAFASAETALIEFDKRARAAAQTG